MICAKVRELLWTDDPFENEMIHKMAQFKLKKLRFGTRLQFVFQSWRSTASQ